MKLREVHIRNFRCHKSLSIPIADSTVILGENNVGKTALIDALNLVLSPDTSPRQKSFDLYDYHMPTSDVTPQTAGAIRVDLLFREDTPREWPEEVAQDLEGATYFDPVTEITSICLRCTSQFDQEAGRFRVKWSFPRSPQDEHVREAEEPLVDLFLSRLWFFHLSALRNPDAAFSVESRFWARFLEFAKVRDLAAASIQRDLLQVNKRIVRTTPELKALVRTLQGADKVIQLEDQAVSLQTIPDRPWELFAKARVMLRTKGAALDLPLNKHGHGIQSLAVFFLIQAFVDVVFGTELPRGSTALMALEEPEAHLHPQASRSLWHVLKGGSQKIISTHSPYLTQEVPLSSIRILRKTGSETSVHFVREHFAVQGLPDSPAAANFCASTHGKYIYDRKTASLKATDVMDEDDFKKLASAFAKDGIQATAKLRELQAGSIHLFSPSVLADLENYVKRIRGEILFARGWLLCEGQSEYFLVRHFAEMLGSPLDLEGVSLIDYRNNGSAGPFVGLAEALGIPWVVTSDTDDQGARTKEEIRKRGIVEGHSHWRVYELTPYKDFEDFLVRSGLPGDCESLAKSGGWSTTATAGTEAYFESLAVWMRKDKVRNALDLIQLLRNQGAGPNKVPTFWRQRIEEVITLANG